MHRIAQMRKSLQDVEATGIVDVLSQHSKKMGCDGRLGVWDRLQGGLLRRWAWCGAKGNAHECRLSEGCGAYALDYYNLIDFSLQIPSLVLALIAFV